MNLCKKKVIPFTQQGGLCSIFKAVLMGRDKKKTQKDEIRLKRRRKRKKDLLGYS